MTDQRDTPDTRTTILCNCGVLTGGAVLHRPDCPMRGVQDGGTLIERQHFPDTRTPSAEGCGHDYHQWERTADGQPLHRWGHVAGDLGPAPWEPCAGQGSDAPSAPNRAPTDVLVERLRRTGRACGPYYADKIQVGPALLDAADALKDLTRENERLHGAVGMAQSIRDAARAERDDLRRQVAALREALASIEYNARSALAALDRGSFNRDDAFLRSDYEWFATTAGAALDTAADRRSEDGYGTDNVPGGWGGP